jgi:hypothetical protein
MEMIDPHVHLRDWYQEQSRKWTWGSIISIFSFSYIYTIYIY